MRSTEITYRKSRSRLINSFGVMLSLTSMPCSFAILSRFRVTMKGMPPSSTLLTSARASDDNERFLDLGILALVCGSCLDWTYSVLFCRRALADFRLISFCRGEANLSVLAMPLLLPFSFLEPVARELVSDSSTGFRGIDSWVALAWPGTSGVFVLMPLF
jgi:hypothetical protein